MEPLIGVLMGGMLTLSGVALTHWWSGKRQRAEWRQADRVRSADRKREAAIAMLQEVGRYALEARQTGQVEKEIRDAAEIRLLACVERLQFELDPAGSAVAEARTLHSMVRSRKASEMEIAECAEDFSKLVRREIEITQQSPEDDT